MDFSHVLRPFRLKLPVSWSRFWFGADGYAQIWLFRRSFYALMLLCYSVRTFDLEFFYSNEGLAPLVIFPDVMDMRYRYSLLIELGKVGLGGKAMLWTAHLALLASLATAALGRAPRFTSIAALVLHLSFVHRNMSIVYGVDLIATFFFLYLCLADPRRQAPSWPDYTSVLGSMAYRLCQIQVCIIYAYSGMEKLKGSHWWGGEAIWDVLANAQLARWDFSWMADFPLAIVAATYATLLWEVYFPVLVWLRPLKPAVLVFWVLLHLGIGLAMSIPFFGGLMIVTYALFLERAWIERFFGIRALSSKRGFR